MSERIQQYLDGELRREDLTAEERSEAEAYERLLREAPSLAERKAAPDLTAAVMARVRESLPGTVLSGNRRGETDGPVARFLLRLWEPRPVRLRPAYGILAAAALLLVTFLPRDDTYLSPAGTPGDASAEEREATPTQVFVQFRLEAPEASSVEVAGTFTGWEPRYSLHEVMPGVWSVLVPLSPGVHEYSFVVDEGNWVPDPLGPRVDDGFGGENTRITILPPYGARES